jgi:hypothetical protein
MAVAADDVVTLLATVVVNRGCPSVVRQRLECQQVPSGVPWQLQHVFTYVCGTCALLISHVSMFVSVWRRVPSLLRACTAPISFYCLSRLLSQASVRALRAVCRAAAALCRCCAHSCRVWHSLGVLHCCWLCLAVADLCCGCILQSSAALWLTCDAV